MTHHLAARMAACLVPAWPPLRFAMAMAVAVLALFAIPAAQAQLSISAGGTPVVNLPLTLPPGIAGLVPSLALVYDGRSVNGPVGQGWSLQGSSAITRCNGIAAIDGTPRSVANAPDDKICFEGQRLIQTDAAGNAASFPQTGDSLGLDAGVREYRTETDSFARIRAYGSAGGASANGPAYFKVWTKSGQIIEYGNGQNTTANAAFTPAGKTVVTTWLASRISDPRGNYIDFQYEQRDVAWGTTPVGGTATPGRELTLQEIRYTGTPARAPNNKIVFLYDERPAAAPAGMAHDRSEVYVLGSKNVSVKRLARIQTFINLLATPVKVKTFKLAYSQGPASNRSRLDQVAECAGPAEQPCLPATRLEYAAGASQAYQASAAFRTSELAGRVMHSTPPPTSYAGATPPIKYGVIPADFNADGKTDILRWSENPAENELHFSNGDGSFRRITAFNITDQIFYRHDGCFGSRVADINGDGLPDILRYRDTSGTWPGGVPHACPAGATEIYFSNGDGSFTRKPVTGVSLVNRRSMLTHGDPLPGEPSGDLIGWTFGDTYYLLDINNDGRIDVVKSHLPSQGNVVPPEPSNPCRIICTRVYLGDGQGSFSEIATNVAYKSLYSPPQGAYAPGQPSHINDFDGDALMDIVGAGAFGQETQNDRARMWRNRGDGNFDEADYGSRGFGHPIDFNGDSRSDLINAGLAPTTLFVADGLNNQRQVSHNFASALTEYFFTATETKYTANIQVADFDSDGRQDVLRWHEDPSKCTLFLSNGDGTFRESASFNLKAAEQVLKNSAGTNEFILGDFTGRGRTEILRLAATPASSGPQANQLYLPVDPAVPPDQLVAVVSAQGLRTDLGWVPLGNSASGSLGERYAGDRADSAHAASYPLADTMMPTWLVATTTADSGAGSQRLTTEYSYRGQKASYDGRGSVGMREMRRQQAGADGSTLLTTVTRQHQKHPYIGALAQAEIWLGALNQASPTVLSRSRHIHCDKSAAAGAEAAAGVATPCPTTARIQRPYIHKSIEEGQDLAGNTLPTVTTTTSVNDSGDPTQVVTTTVGSVGGVSQVFTRTITHLYHPDLISGDQWLLGRVQQTSVHNSVPDSLANLATSAGNAANAGATSGSGAMQQVAVLTPTLAFGNVVVGLSATLDATLANTGPASLSLTVPGTGAVSGADFSFVSTTCGATLAVGANCSASLRFSPGSAVARSGTLMVSTGAGTLSASLGGTGIVGSSTAVLTSAAALSLGSVNAGAAAPQQAWTWRNDGNAPMSLVLGTLNTPFSLVGNTCSGVLPGGTCAITVRMGTGAGGTYSQGGIAISGAGSGNRADLSLGGTVAAPTTLSVSPASLAFGTVTKGLNKSLTLTLSNTGGNAATGLGYAFANPAGAVVRGSYGYAPGASGWGTCPTAGGSLAAGATCTVIVKYAADCTGGSNNGTLSISGANFTTLAVAVSAATSSSGICQ